MTGTFSLLRSAQAAAAAGVCVIPAASDGSKAPWPDGPRWQPYQHAAPTPAQLERWFGPGGMRGMGLVCGQVSGGLELLEFEGRAVDDGLVDQFWELAESLDLLDVVERVADGYQENTPSGGIHWLYRCPGAVTGNLKLARRPGPDGGTVEVLIETRGEGGFVIVAPSNGTTHPTGKAWELALGGFDTIATITPDERAALHDLARTFDTTQPPASAAAVPVAEAGGHLSDSRRPGDDFNARTSWHDVLDPAGWQQVFQRGAVGYWRRPGKTVGVSATTNALGTDRLKVFSSSTAFDTETTYDRFGAHALLEHRGDLRAAAKALKLAGYGSSTRPTHTDPATADPTGPPPATPETPADPEASPLERFECTDLGNARRLVAAYGDDLRYVPEWGKWLAWDGRRWEIDVTGQVDRWAKTVVDNILDEQVDAARAGKTDLAKKLFSHWIKSQAAQRLSAMVAVATTEPGVPVRVSELDADPWALNTLSGTLDLRTGDLRPHTRDDHLTKLAPVSWDWEAPRPVFDAFLERITAGDALVAGFIQRAIGYSITGDVSEQVLFFCHGAGANGKSTLMSIVLRVLGDYAKPAAPNLLVNDGSTQHPTAIADLVGRRFVVSQEVEEGRRLDEQLVKQLTGGDQLKARFMRQDFFDFAATHKLWLCANHKPFVRGTDHAIWRRIRLMPFTVTIPDHEQDKELDAKLADEAEGILGWAVQGTLWWLRDGLQPPPSVMAATADYRVENDVVGRFLDERCLLGPDLRASSASLRGAYVEWCEDAGERPMSQRAFAPHLRERGLESVRDRRGHTWWFGVAVNEGSRAQPSELDLQ